MKAKIRSTLDWKPQAALGLWSRLHFYPNRGRQVALVYRANVMYLRDTSICWLVPGSIEKRRTGSRL
jgi:hypothetical protein